jgi:hypothetical protein
LVFSMRLRVAKNSFAEWYGNQKNGGRACKPDSPFPDFPLFRTKDLPETQDLRRQGCQR